MFPFFTPGKEKLPSKSVIVPVVVPFTTTEAPITGPIASTTVPVAVSLCCVIFTSSAPVEATAKAAPVEAPIKNSIILTVLSRFNIAVIFKVHPTNA